jgi:hypothetical protein
MESRMLHIDFWGFTINADGIYAIGAATLIMLVWLWRR